MNLTSSLILFLLVEIISTVRGMQPRRKVIYLKDNTDKDVVVGSVPDDGSTGAEPVTYALLTSAVNSYFQVDKSTGQLKTQKRVDRDRLCLDSALCCVGKVAGSQTASSLSQIISSSGRHQRGSVCILRLNVAVTAGHERGLSPTTHSLFVEVQDENDHAPVFALPSQTHHSDNYGDINPFGVNVPPLVLNISEAAHVGAHRLHLPLATDLDAPPFNVQSYVVESDFPKHLFKLDVLKRERSPTSSSGFPMEGPHDNALIKSLDLVLIAPLDRETTPTFKFRILAIDGGFPSPKTGTLSVEIQVTDSNDNMPKFQKSVYETYVNEGEVGGVSILRVLADDLDEGMNARILYSWMPDNTRFHDDLKLLDVDELTDRKIKELCGDGLSPERMAQLQALPNYWFRLDSKTGEIFIHRPLDFETKRSFVFYILASNPRNTEIAANSVLESGDASITINPESITKVTMNVRNLNDEIPQITVDYVGNEGTKYKTVMENGKVGYFIALIRATDRDASFTKTGESYETMPVLDNDPYIQSSSHHMNFYSPIDEHIRSLQANGLVSCELVNYKENYTLLNRSETIDSGSEYELITKAPLDREKEQRHVIKIECYDHGKPAKHANATVEVVIQDENDCSPEIVVHVPVTSRSNRPQSTVPRSHLFHILSEAYPGSFLPPSMGLGPRLPDHPLAYAYATGIPVVVLSVPENRPPGTLVASIRASDGDAGDNGRVSYRILKEDFQLPMVIAGIPSNEQSATGKYPEAELDHSRQPVIISSDVEAVEMFKLEPNGDIKTRRLLDREESTPIQDEKYLLVEARDHGDTPHISYVLLAIAIKDENDNTPIFVMPQMNFTVLENQIAPRWIGDLLVFDRDMGTRGPPHEDPLLSKEHISPRISKPVKNSISLIINPSHGLPDLPFVIGKAPDGRFFLNVTRSLDHEVEEAFLFNVLVTDYGSAPQRTATANILVTVIDTNDNPPEITFPLPATSASHVHKLSVRELSGFVIFSLIANDKDSDDDNKALRFDLGAPLTSIPRLESASSTQLAKTALLGDLFKVDAVKGLLQTQRRMTEADLGEHWLQLIVRDLGNPPLETYQTLRLEVDLSPFSRPSLNNNGELLDSNLERFQFPGRPDLGTPPRDWASSSRGSDNVGSLVSDIALFVIISLLLAAFLVITGVCIYLRHRQKLFQCLPDVCDLFRRQEGNEYNSPNYVCNKSKVRKDDPRRGPPVADSSLLNFVGGGFSSQPRSKCSSQLLSNLMSNRFQLETPPIDYPDFLERPKVLTEYYHVGMPFGHQPQQNSRMVSMPATTFKPIMSPIDFQSNGNMYNAANTVQTSSPMHRQTFASMNRHGEPMHSLFVNSNDVMDQHQNQSLSPNTNIRSPGVMPVCFKRNPANASTAISTNIIELYNNQQNTAQPPQGSCDFIMMEDEHGGRKHHALTALEKQSDLNAVKNARRNHYKSEPSLVFMENQSQPGMEEDENDEEMEQLIARRHPSEIDEVSFKTWRRVSKGDNTIPSIVNLKGRTALLRGNNIGETDVVAEQMENYAVSFPKLQSSFV